MKTQSLLEPTDYQGVITQWNWEEDYNYYRGNEKRKVSNLTIMLKFHAGCNDKAIVIDRYAKQFFSFTAPYDIMTQTPYLFHLANLVGIEEVDLCLTKDYDTNLAKLAAAFPAELFVNKKLRFTLCEGGNHNIANCKYDIKTNKIVYIVDKFYFSNQE